MLVASPADPDLRSSLEQMVRGAPAAARGRRTQSEWLHFEQEKHERLLALLPSPHPTNGESCRIDCHPTATTQDYKVADLSLADFGRKEIELAEHEMPGLMALRAEYGDAQAAGRAPASPARCT